MHINWKYIGIIVLLLLVAFGFCLSGYSGGYWLGEYKGRQQGYNYAMERYPLMTLDDVNISYFSENTSLSFSGLTIQGEQRIIDFINNLPNFKNIIYFHDSKSEGWKISE